MNKKFKIASGLVLGSTLLYAALAYAEVVRSPFRTEHITIGKGGAADNVKLHRGASGLQAVPGTDSTADGVDSIAASKFVIDSGAGDVSFDVANIAANVATVKAGGITLNTGLELRLVADLAVNLKTGVNPDGVDQSEAQINTQYYLYLDLSNVPDPTTDVTTGHQRSLVTAASEFIVLASTPENTSSSRFLPIASLMTDGSADYTGAGFRNIQKRRHDKAVTNVSPVVYRVDKQSIGTVGAVENAQGELVDGDFNTASVAAAFAFNGDDSKTAGTATANMTVVDAPDYVGAGFFGREAIARFNGIDDELNSSEVQFDLGSGGGFAYGAWIKLNNNIGFTSTGLLGQWGDSSTNLSARFTLGDLELYCQTSVNGTSIESTPFLTNLVLGKWAHIAMTSDGSTFAKCYVDGVVVSNSVITGVFNSSVPFQIATTEENDTQRNTAMDMQDFFIERTALTDAQINAIYSKRFKGKQLAGGHVLTPDSFSGDLTDKISFYNLDNDDGATILDDSVNSRGLTKEGTPTFDGLGLFGLADAMTFDGSTDLLSSTDASFNTVEQTISLWVAADDWSNGATQSLVQIGSGNGASRLLYLRLTATGGIHATWSGGAGEVIVITLEDHGFTDGSWHHVAIKHEGVSGYLYIDGVLVGKVEQTAPVVPSPTDIFTIGSRENSGRELFFTGRMSNISFSNHGLSQQEIRKLYSSRVDHNAIVSQGDQQWTGSFYQESSKDNQVNNLDSQFVAHKSPNSVYLDFNGFDSGEQVSFELSDLGLSASGVIPARALDTGFLTSAPVNPLPHSLGQVPTAVTILHEVGVNVYDKLETSSYCQLSNVNLDCDFSSLTIGASNRLRVIAGSGESATVLYDLFETGVKTRNEAKGSRFVGAGETLTHPELSVPAGKTYQVEGLLITTGVNSGTGTIAGSGSIRSMSKGEAGTKAVFEGDVQIKGNLSGGSPVKIVGGLNVEGGLTIDGAVTTDGDLAFKNSGDVQTWSLDQVGTVNQVPQGQITPTRVISSGIGFYEYFFRRTDVGTSFTTVFTVDTTGRATGYATIAACDSGGTGPGSIFNVYWSAADTFSASCDEVHVGTDSCQVTAGGEVQIDAVSSTRNAWCITVMAMDSPLVSVP